MPSSPMPWQIRIARGTSFPASLRGMPEIESARNEATEWKKERLCGVEEELERPVGNNAVINETLEMVSSIGTTEGETPAHSYTNSGGNDNRHHQQHQHVPSSLLLLLHLLLLLPQGVEEGADDVDHCGHRRDQGEQQTAKAKIRLLQDFRLIKI